MFFTGDGIAYTTDKLEAYKYRNEDRSPKFVKKKDNPYYIKYIPHYYYDKNNKIYFLPPRLSKRNQHNFNQINYNFTYELYDYQQKAVHFFSDSEYKSVLMKAGVGCGKTIIGAGAINIKKTPTLIITPRDLICKGRYNTLKSMCNVEYRTADKIRKAIQNKQLPDVLISTVSSIEKIIDDINGYYDLLIFDEAHRLSDGAKHILNCWKGGRIIGLSATPKRKEMYTEDMVDYFGGYIDLEIEALPVQVYTYKFTYHYSINDFLKACEGLDPESPEVLRRLVNANDYKISVLRNKIITKLYQMGIRKFILFVDRVDYAYKIQKRFPKAIIISGESDKQKAIDSIKDKDEYLIIAMSSCAGEGFNLPDIECGILFYSTEWDNSIEQLCGRARRKSGNKKVCYRIDVQEKSKIVDKRNRFHSQNRLKYYKQRGWDIKELN